MKYQIAHNSSSQRISAFGNPFLFTGRRLDDQTGLYYYRNRFNEPRKGRFLGRDPLEFVDSLNFYAYTTNNPLKYRDPKGLVRCPGTILVTRAGEGATPEQGCRIAKNRARNNGYNEANAKCQKAGRKKNKTCYLNPAPQFVTCRQEDCETIKQGGKTTYLCSASAQYQCISKQKIKQCLDKEREEIDKKLFWINVSIKTNEGLIIAGKIAGIFLVYRFRNKIIRTAPNPVPVPFP